MIELETVATAQEHGGQVNAKWGKDLIVLVPPDYYGRCVLLFSLAWSARLHLTNVLALAPSAPWHCRAPPGAEVYSYDYVLSSIRKNSLQAPLPALFLSDLLTDTHAVSLSHR